MIKRGDIWLCNLDDTSFGCEQSGRRPVIILQNDTGNAVSPVTTVVPLTSRIKHFVPTHVRIRFMSVGRVRSVMPVVQPWSDNHTNGSNYRIAGQADAM